MGILWVLWGHALQRFPKGFSHSFGASAMFFISMGKSY